MSFLEVTGETLEELSESYEYGLWQHHLYKANFSTNEAISKPVSKLQQDQVC